MRYLQCIIAFVFLISASIAVRPQQEAPLLDAPHTAERFSASLRRDKPTDSSADQKKELKAEVQEIKGDAKELEEKVDTDKNKEDTLGSPKSPGPAMEKAVKADQATKKEIAAESLAGAAVQEVNESKVKNDIAKDEGESTNAAQTVEDSSEAVEAAKVLEDEAKKATNAAESSAQDAKRK